MINKGTLLLGFIILLFVGACNNPNGQEGEASSETDKFNAFVDQVYEDWLSRHPMSQTRQGIRENYDQWGDISDENRLAEIQITKDNLKQLKETIDYEKLDPQAKVSYKIFEYEAKTTIASEPYIYHSYPVEQMHGMHANIPNFLMNMHKIDSLQDADDYVKRLIGVQSLMDAVIRKMKVREEKGIIPPKFVFPMVIDDCKNILKGQPFDPNSKEPSDLLADFTKKIEGAGIVDENKESLLSSVDKALTQYVKPAYESLITYLAELEKKATTDDGVWKFPQGGEFYQMALNRTTTTKMTPEEIHQKGLAEVERIHNEMREIMKQVEFKEDLPAFMDYMRNSDEFYYSNDEKGKKEYLDKATEIINTMKKELDKLFITQPKAGLEVVAVEPYREKSAGKAFYQRGTPDGSRPGYYYANLYDMKSMPTYQMEALAYHEAIPGHHMQISIAQELEGLPKFRKFGHYTAYVEGWALYTEFLPKEIGFYKNPYSDFGRLAMELWRACRLVVDTGIHTKKWTRDKAIKYLMDNTPNAERDCVKAIERYIVMPSQATAYKIGMLKILELREAAKQRLGDGFDIRTFHDIILTNGPVPLSILEELINEMK